MSKGTGWMVAGAVFLLGALSLVAWNTVQSDRAAKASEKALPDVVQTIENNREAHTGANIPAESGIGSGELPEEIIPQWLVDPDTPMPEMEVDGHSYIGVLAIPALSLELPVMSGWNYDDLQISPCRYRGSVYKGDLVLAAHNYLRHFGRLRELSLEDEVFFTDGDGNVFPFAVAAIETLPPSAVEEMTAGEWPLSLFTCTQGGGERVTVRCVAVE